MVNELFQETKTRMGKAVEHYLNEVAGIRTGRATANILDSVKVDYYGAFTPVNNMAQIGIPEPQLIVIQPFDRNSLPAIEKAIRQSDLGLNPNNDGIVIRLNIPALTNERRTQLIRIMHKMIEEGRIEIRNIRRDANEQLKKWNKINKVSDDNLKRALDNVQEMTDKHIAELNTIQERKEKELEE